MTSRAEQIANETIQNTMKYQPPVDMNYLSRQNNQINYTNKEYNKIFEKAGYDMPLKDTQETNKYFKNPIELIMYSMN